MLVWFYGHVFVEYYLTKGDVQMSQKYTKEFKETIVQLHEAGQPVSDLVKEYGVANQTIY